MTPRPLIGITGRRKNGDQLVGNLDVLADFSIDLYYADYGRGVLEAGGLPIHVPLDVDAAALDPRLDGLLLTGGADVDPGRDGQKSSTDTFPPEPLRDEHEYALLDVVYAYQMPVAGICRGLQVINVHAGGTLHQDVPSHAGFDTPATTERHNVAFDAGSVEGLEHEGLPVVAGQWHPEMLPTRAEDALFAWLVAEASARR